jgi:hypothetical protein
MAGEQALSGPGLPENQDGGVDRGGPPEKVADATEGGARSEQWGQRVHVPRCPAPQGTSMGGWAAADWPAPATAPIFER